MCFSSIYTFFSLIYSHMPFVFLDSNTSSPAPARLEGQTLWVPTHSPSASGSSLSPFQDVGYRPQAHVGVSTMAGLKRERGINSSGTKSGTPSGSSTTRSPSDVASLRPTTVTSVAWSAANPLSDVSVVDASSEPGGPPAYETIAAQASPS